MLKLTSIVPLLVGLSIGVAVRAGDGNGWTQFRGPTRDGQIGKSDFVWPDKLENLETVWHAELADGYSQPLVSGDRVFTVETKAGKEIARAFDRKSGKQMWEASWEGQMAVPFFAMRNGSWVRSTPALDGDRLYVGGMRDVLVCLNANDGKVIWGVDFVERYKSPLPAFGLVCSPLVTADGVYIQAGVSFVKINKSTGEEIWRTLVEAGGMEDSAFSSPVVATIAGKEQILVQARKFLAGVDPATGKAFWKIDVPSFRGMNVLNPTVFGENGVFTSTYGGATQLIKVSATEGQQAEAPFAAKPAWKLPIEANLSSPVVMNGYLYVQRRDKKLSCIELATGKEKWTAKADLSDYASMATDGKKILALDSKGELILLKHNPDKLEVLDRKKISEEETWAHVVIVGNEVFVRSQKGITLFRWK